LNGSTTTSEDALHLPARTGKGGAQKFEAIPTSGTTVPNDACTHARTPLTHAMTKMSMFALRLYSSWLLLLCDNTVLLRSYSLD